MKPVVTIGLLGPILDVGKRPSRWERWRPSVALCQQDDLLVSRFDLLYQEQYTPLMERLVADIAQVSPETEVAPHVVEFNDPWDFEEVYAQLHDFARAYPFDDDEDYLVHITTGTHVAQICLFLLIEARYIPARILQTSPLPKSRFRDTRGSYRIIDLDLSRYDRIASRFEKEIADDISFLKSGIETRNEAFNTLIARIERVAANSTEPMLLTGPTGAGKTLLARRIHALKKARRQISGPFVEVNCATLRGDQAMSALFGHKKGAFTGALADREGLLRAAHGGMLFLDEVGELGLDEQAMLLRAIEEKRFLPVGADAEVESSFQLICGTNRDLTGAVSDSRFRADLLARVNLWTFALPGLCDRPEDIEPNLVYELERFAEKNSAMVTFNREAKKKFLSFAASPHAAWTGNFRDLNGAVTRMATLAPGGRITEAVVDEEIARLLATWQNDPGFGSGRGGDRDDPVEEILGSARASRLDRFDRVQLADVLAVCRRSRTISEAGRELFAVSREEKRTKNDADRVRKYLLRYGIAWSDLRSQK